VHKFKLRLAVYQIFKKYAYTSYKNTHKRVKRLAELGLIEKSHVHLRGAIHYRITNYGLIMCFNHGALASEDPTTITNNMESIIIRHLLLHLFEKETMCSFYKLRDFPAINIVVYLEECCSLTSETCKRFWKNFERYQIGDLLPSDNIIQEYMKYLDGKRVDTYVIDEIKEYEKRLMAKMQNDGNDKSNNGLSEAIDRYNGRYFQRRSYLPSDINYKAERPPFPLLELYDNIVYQLQDLLENKANQLCFEIVSEIGYFIKSEHIENRKQLEKFLEKNFIDYSLSHILKDKKFIQHVESIKGNFDMGYEHLYFHDSH
jgi:hypothetical protein